jgi:RNA polymerase sigma-70 factor (ECF subfamily)
MGAEGPPEDATLVEAALAGDDAAFSALMKRHKEPLYRFVRRYVGDADEALDLVQDTFVASWTALDRFDTARAFPVWLRRIALNKCRDWSRRRQVRRFFFGAVSLETAPPIADNTEPAPQEPVLDERLTALDAAIARLPIALKEPLLLTVFEELSHQEAAALLGISAKAVETRVYRAKQHLRGALADDKQAH